MIDNTIKLIEENGKKIDIENIPFDDQEVYKLLTKGLTIGVFQFESSGMRISKKLEPITIEDLIAMNEVIQTGPQQHRVISSGASTAKQNSLSGFKYGRYSERNVWYYCLSRTSNANSK